MPAYCLNIHASYACAHSGACCTAGWPIAIGRDLADALRRGGLLSPSQTIAGAPETSTLTLRTADDGACVFFEAERGRLCRIHRTAGVELLPTACRNFPRITLRDPRGTFITLSNFCPTAARMLLAAGDITIVDAPASLALDGEAEGLDATRVMPPLLRAGMLMDLDGYSVWEQEGIAVLNERRDTPRAALAVLSTATIDSCSWRPGREPLATRIHRDFTRARLQASLPVEAPSPFGPATTAFLASHLFASWSAYENGGLPAVVHSLEAALELLEHKLAITAPAAASPDDTFIAAVRATDFELRHTAVRAPIRGLTSPAGCS